MGCISPQGRLMARRWGMAMTRASLANHRAITGATCGQSPNAKSGAGAAPRGADAWCRGGTGGLWQ